MKTIDEEIAEAERRAADQEANAKGHEGCAAVYKKRAAEHRARLAELRARKAAESRTYGDVVAEENIRPRFNGDGLSFGKGPQSWYVPVLGDLDDATLRAVRRIVAGLVNAARADERESCAQLAESYAPSAPTLKEVATAIRGRQA